MPHHRFRTLPVTALALCALVAGCAQPAAVPEPSTRNASADAYVARARDLAGNDLQYLMRLCQPQPAERAKPSAAMDDGLRKLIARPAPAPTQVFDNLYFVGGAWVSAWVIRTSEGLVLLDALNNGEEARALIEGGLAKLGLDPRQIRYIIVTHGHGDHYGGAKYLAEKYRARVVSSDADWNMMHGKLEFDSKVWDPPPARDLSVNDLEKLVVGDTTFTFYVTTGHTLGTLSVGFDVKGGGRTHHAFLWGGTSFNFGKDFSRLESYIGNTERISATAQRMPIDVFLSNHPDWDGSITKMNALRTGAATQPNPFVVGPATVGRSMRVMGDCARAQAARFGY